MVFDKGAGSCIGRIAADVPAEILVQSSTAIDTIAGRGKRFELSQRTRPDECIVLWFADLPRVSQYSKTDMAEMVADRFPDHVDFVDRIQPRVLSGSLRQ